MAGEETIEENQRRSEQDGMSWPVPKVDHILISTVEGVVEVYEDGRWLVGPRQVVEPEAPKVRHERYY